MKSGWVHAATARIMRALSFGARPKPRQPGALKGEIEIGPDFDAPLDEFADYR